MDSGADGNVIDETFVEQLNISTVLIDQPIEVLAMYGKFLFKVSLTTVPLSLTLSGNHQVSFQPLVNKLFLKANKCEFHGTSVNLLGFVIEQGQLRADQDKI